MNTRLRISMVIDAPDASDEERAVIERRVMDALLAGEETTPYVPRFASGDCATYHSRFGSVGSKGEI